MRQMLQILVFVIVAFTITTSAMAVEISDESAGIEYGQTPVIANVGNTYPVGSYIDEAGNVFSSEGDLLSSGITPASDPGIEGAASSDVLDPQSSSEVAPVEDGMAVYSVVDLRSDADFALASDAGLKSLIVSIFGSYEPVTEETVLTETIEGSTVETTIRTVVPGLAGVDYQWIGSVLIFGVLVFCLGKLLGGVAS